MAYKSHICLAFDGIPMYALVWPKQNVTKNISSRFFVFLSESVCCIFVGSFVRFLFTRSRRVLGKQILTLKC